jgi:hypothetical protein
MLSSVEIWDTATLRHSRSVSFGRTDGSLTWLDRRDGRWIACFVHYGKKGGEPGKGPEWTRLAEYDDDWQPTGRGWTFPPELVTHLGGRGYSVSGGAVGSDRRLLVTGHDEPEIYVLDFPTEGSQLRWIATIAAPIEGQAFGWDPKQKDTIYLLSRRDRQIIVGKILAP